MTGFKLLCVLALAGACVSDESIDDVANFVGECVRIAIDQRPALKDLGLPELNPMVISHTGPLTGVVAGIGYNVTLENIQVYNLGSFAHSWKTQVLDQSYKVETNGYYVTLYFLATYNVTYAIDSIQYNYVGNLRTIFDQVQVSGSISVNKLYCSNADVEFSDLTLGVNVGSAQTNLLDIKDTNIDQISTDLTTTFQRSINDGTYSPILQPLIMNYLNDEWASKPDRVAGLVKFCHDQGL